MLIKACIHTDYLEAIGPGEDQGKLITSWSSAEVNYLAFHNKDQGPILRLFLSGMRNTCVLLSLLEHTHLITKQKSM